nr:MAG TPA: hypothetical protein [Caudoviricetes sp.]
MIFLKSFCSACLPCSLDTYNHIRLFKPCQGIFFKILKIFFGGCCFVPSLVLMM